MKRSQSPARLGHFFNNPFGGGGKGTTTTTALRHPARRRRRAVFIGVCVGFALLLVLAAFPRTASSLHGGQIHHQSGLGGGGLLSLFGRRGGGVEGATGSAGTSSAEAERAEVAAAIAKLRSAFDAAEGALDDSLLRFSANKHLFGPAGEDVGKGGGEGTLLASSSTSSPQQNGLMPPAEANPPTAEQLIRLRKQRDYLTVRYDRTVHTPYAPSLTSPYGAGHSFYNNAPIGGAAGAAAHRRALLSPAATASARRGPHWHRRQWAIPHPRPSPAVVAARKKLFKDSAGGHLPTVLITPENGDSIFVAIASYRDDQCAPTVHDMYIKARYPENLYVGIVQQHDNDENGGDRSCIPPQFGQTIFVGGVRGGAADGTRSQHYEQRAMHSSRRSLKQHSEGSSEGALTIRRSLLKWGSANNKKDSAANNNDGLSNNNPYSSWRQGGRSNAVGCQHDYGFCPTDNMRLRHILPKHSKGPTFGRYVGFLMYRGEQYVFMMDSHNRFVSNWDLLLVGMHKRLQKNQRVRKPVLSHYPEAWDNPADNSNGADRNAPLDNRGSTAYLCKANFIGWGIPRLEGIVIARPSRPLPQPWAAAGFIFADGALVSQVPFDPHLDYVFDGEEVTYSVRMFTHGWNIFSPSENVMYHYYTRKGAKRFWGLVPANYNERRGIAEKRIQYLIHATVQGSVTEPLVGGGLSVAERAFFHACNGDRACYDHYFTPRLAQLLNSSSSNGGNGNAVAVVPLPSSVESASLPQKLLDVLARKGGAVGNNVADVEYRYLNSAGRYGMGAARSVEDWWAYSGMDRKERKPNHNKFCQFEQNQRSKGGDYFVEKYD